MKLERREFLVTAAALGATGLGGATALMIAAPPKSQAVAQPGRTPRKSPEHVARAATPGKPEDEEPNSPPESLMLEHAVADRLLLIYAECADRLRAQADDTTIPLLQFAAATVRKYHEDCHQAIEEQYVFPLFESQARWAPLIKTLKAQHVAGRALTDKILAGTAPGQPVTPELRTTLAKNCATFVRMTRPHMARESTELFLTLYELLPEQKVEEMGERFEEKQEQILGENALAKVLEQIVVAEKQLGIYDLDKFTPAE